MEEKLLVLSVVPSVVLSVKVVRKVIGKAIGKPWVRISEPLRLRNVGGVGEKGGNRVRGRKGERE